MTSRHLLGLALFGMTSAPALFSPHAASAVECRICETFSNPSELLEYSASLNSGAVRHQIRGWLAEHKPDTAGGTAARAWMASNAGDEDTATRLYLEALKMDASLSTAAVNVSFPILEKSGIDAANAMLAPMIGHPEAGYIPMWNTFWNLYEAQRQDEAMRLLETWEQDGTEPRWVTYGLRAHLASRQNERATADELYLRGMDLEEEIDFDLFDRWLSNRRRLETQRGVGNDARRQTYDMALDLAARVTTPMAYEQIGVYAEEHLNDNILAFNARAEGVRDLALPELVSGAFFDVANTYPDYAFDVLDRGLTDFPYNYDVAMTELEAYTLFKIDPARAKAAATRGLANVTTGKTIRDVGAYVMSNRARLGDYDSAPALMAELLPQVQGNDRRSLLGSYVNNRLAAHDFTAARSALADYKALGGDASWAAKRADLIDFYSAMIDDRDQWRAAHPFLRDWEARFGDSLRAAIQFETGKATILPESDDVIETAADALKAPGGEDYVFQIEGHTDSRGTDAVNFPLSKARAEAVKDFLVNRLGLEASRIQTRGFGPKSPIAPNATDAGRQENRRVEIRPLGNVNDPQVATPGAYNIAGMDVSQDGRIAVMGHSPTQVWDLERNVVLHEISAGGGHKISPNGRYLASSSGFKRPSGETTYTLFIYDLRTGKLVDYLEDEREIGYFSWSPFSDKIAYMSMQGYIRVYDMAERKITGITRLSTVRGTGAMVWLNSGADLVVKVAENRGDIYVLDPDTLRQKRVIRESGWIHALGQSHDGRYVIASRNDHSFSVWDTQNDWAEIASGGLPLIGRKIYAHPTEPWVLMYAKFDTETRVLLMDLTNGKILATSDLKIEGGGFTADGDRFITGAGDELLELDTRTLSVATHHPSVSPLGQDVHIFDAGGLVLSTDASGSAVWSLQTGRRVHVFDTVLAGGWKAIPDQDSKVLGVQKDGHDLVVFDSNSFQAETIWHTDDDITDVEIEDGLLVVATVPTESGNRGQSDPQAVLHVIDLASLKTLHRIEAAIVTGPLNYGGDAFSFNASIELDGGIVALRTAYSDGFRRGVNNSRVLRLYEARSGRDLSPIARDTEIEGFDLTDGGKQVKIRNTGEYTVYNVATGRSEGTAAYDPLYTLDLADGRQVRWFWDRVMLDDKVLTFPMSLRSLSVSERNNVLVGQTRTGKIHFIDLSRLKTALTIMPFSNGEWIAYTPSGNYTASLDGTEGVYWSLGDNYLPFDALANQFSKPNLVQDLLTKLAAGALTDADVRDPEVQPDTFDAPYHVELVTPASLSTRDDNVMIELKVQKDSSDLPNPEFRYTLNGREVVQSRGFEEEAFFEDSETVTVSRRFELRPGANTIEASLMWKGAAVATAHITVHREVNRQDVAAGSGALWFFGVGVSKYENASQNLEFAAKDASALAALLQDQSRGLFSDVHTKVLTDENATERDVRIEMNEFLSQSKPDDVVIVFIAGHGVTDEEQNLYFVTHDADLARPYTGMNVERFRAYLENRPLNQSALLLLDICHSGTAGRVVSEDAVQKLSEGTGAIVFSSSSGSGLAYEDSSFGGGHGAFTAALLDALRGMADNDTGNRDGQNSLQEMVIYTSAEVPRLTQGLQRPTIPMMAQGLDYGISTAQNNR